MSEQAPSNSEYLEHHPNAIQDVDTAHEIAAESDEFRTQASAMRVGLKVAADALANGNSPREELVRIHHDGESGEDTNNEFAWAVSREAVAWPHEDSVTRQELGAHALKVLDRKLSDIDTYEGLAEEAELKKAQEIESRPENVSKKILQELDKRK